ncbi:MAG: beta-ketoacyl-ACP synthase II [Phycisphaerae bacterium]|nr:beta-ketoacyl-ACP synthase II [Phycisphaerae bacterium]
MSERRRVVVTGLGTVNSLGHRVAEFWENLLSCKSGIRPIARFDASPYASQIGGEVQGWSGVQSDQIDARENKRMDRFAQFAVSSAIEAVDDSGIAFTDANRNRCGVLVGSGIGGLEELENQHLRLLNKGARFVSPFTVPKLMVNAASGNISIIWQLRGPNSATATACASAGNAIGEAIRIIQRNEADVMITGGSEAALTPIGLASFCALKGLSTRNDEPHTASRPWDAGRDGFLLSEGAGIIVIEALDHARQRSADIYAELIGYGCSGDGYHISAPDPDGDGAVLAINHALQDAQVAPDEVDYVNAHGTSTVLGDLAETVAMKKCFGDHAYKLAVSSTKSSTGHLLGASAGVEIVATTKALHEGILPATLNLNEPDENCDLDYVPLTPRQTQVSVALSNSFGFGGHNACLLLRRFTG